MSSQLLNPSPLPKLTHLRSLIVAQANSKCTPTWTCSPLSMYGIYYASVAINLRANRCTSVSNDMYWLTTDFIWATWWRWASRLTVTIPALLRCETCEKSELPNYHYSTDSDHILSQFPPMIRMTFPLVRGRQRAWFHWSSISIALRLGAQATLSSIHYAHQECIANKLTEASIAAFDLMSYLNTTTIDITGRSNSIQPVLLEKDHNLAVSCARISRYCLLKLERQEMDFKASFKEIMYKLIRCDHTFKVASHVFTSHDDGTGAKQSEHPFSALLTIMNVNQQVGFFAFFATKSMKEFEPHTLESIVDAWWTSSHVSRRHRQSNRSKAYLAEFGPIVFSSQRRKRHHE